MIAENPNCVLVKRISDAFYSERKSIKVMIPQTGRSADSYQRMARAYEIDNLPITKNLKLVCWGCSNSDANEVVVFADRVAIFNATFAVNSWLDSYQFNTNLVKVENHEMDVAFDCGIPDSFLESLKDLESGNIVNLDVALTEPPPE